MDADKKHDILSLSSSGENEFAHGSMGKLKDIIETGALNYESVIKLNQKYNGVPVNFGMIGTYSDLGATSAIPNSFTGLMWSMSDYKEGLDNEDNNLGAKDAYDELEKSIVASIAKDVIVGVKKDKVELKIIYDIMEGK